MPENETRVKSADHHMEEAARLVAIARDPGYLQAALVHAQLATALLIREQAEELAHIHNRIQELSHA